MPVHYPLTRKPTPPQALPGDAGSAAPRIVGVDTARGLALLGMFAVHVYGAFASDGSPTPAWVFAGGRSAATFALLAGVGLAFTTGGRRPDVGRPQYAAVATRAALIGLVGLLLGYASRAADLDVDVILAYYALLFLLAIPLMRLRPGALTALSLTLAVAGPVVVHVLRGVLPQPAFDGDPVLTDVFTDPLGLLSNLLVQGNYPALAWMAYLCAGLAVGRLDLTSARIARRLLVGGLALAAAAWLTATALLTRFGGLWHLWRAEFPHTPWPQARHEVLWDTGNDSTWWSLLSRAPHSTSPFDLLQTLGSACSLLGAALLLTRLTPTRRLLSPLTAAGTMPLTLYCAHVLLLATGALGDSPDLLYGLLVAGSLLFAACWRRAVGRGPLETGIAVIARGARQVTRPSVEPQSSQSS
ncbi:heparan-alpha-glucosaminide N-acetyltransferase domain-containing protein [Streptomyces pseudovenezuelae]|uniref:Membrane protein YeiB n=1 Tax=Streptomyces pseudovenezuelae TaxID=67350 RepID=A0ABT6LCQ6_9ACTN|nr:heparan-alpha-glucosaminide N-acetyltransferase domain-containing protein [Streptomyces pseudovenezuelae]MDH6213589.1 putative membrane protein YeiB [Streptomyces pseudovenezuelae]